jgi:hypothetical protein
MKKLTKIKNERKGEFFCFVFILDQIFLKRFSQFFQNQEKCFP